MAWFTRHKYTVLAHKYTDCDCLGCWLRLLKMLVTVAKDTGYGC